MLYSQYETMKFALKPISHLLTKSLSALNYWDKMFPQLSMLSNYQQARYSLTNNLIKDYPKMPWNIKPIVDENGVSHSINEDVVINKTFCDFKLFTLDGVTGREAIFMAAPLSGHFATLLRDTLQTCLKDYDVYITDWKNCRDIPVKEGEFNFEDYVSYVIEFSKYVKDKHGTVNIIAVCQPTVPVAVAASYLAKNDPEYQFDNVILMGGPLDTRISPTKVNEYAFNKTLDWFKNNVIDTVPIYFNGRGRKVYPGFLQHMGFLSMNMKRHTKAHMDFFNHLLIGANLDAIKHQQFYDEYNAVMDLPAAYYLETLAHIFIDQSLAKDKMEVFGARISMSDIKKGNYFLLEGELDDISGAGQTHAAYDMLSGLPESNKHKYLAEDVGHYGIFSGSGFRNNIYPMIKAFINNEKLTPTQESKTNLNGDTVHIKKYKKPETPIYRVDTIVDNFEENVVVPLMINIDLSDSSVDSPVNNNSSQDFLKEYTTNIVTTKSETEFFKNGKTIAKEADKSILDVSTTENIKEMKQALKVEATEKLATTIKAIKPKDEVSKKVISKIENTKKNTVEKVAKPNKDNKMLKNGLQSLDKTKSLKVEHPIVIDNTLKPVLTVFKEDKKLTGENVNESDNNVLDMVKKEDK